MDLQNSSNLWIMKIKANGNERDVRLRGDTPAQYGGLIVSRSDGIYISNRRGRDGLPWPRADVRMRWKIKDRDDNPQHLLHKNIKHFPCLPLALC